jgi:ABC-2 type transport system ATP-binding protein
MNGESVVADRLTMRFGKFTAVDDVSFSVNRGEIFGFLGANGAGKTTTIRMLCGLLVPTAGEARVAGASVRAESDTVKSRVGYMSQKFTLYNDLTVEENLDFAGALRRMDGEAITRRKAQMRELIGMDAHLDSLVRDLPPGVKQQVALTASIFHDPAVVFLDEPTAGVTPAARAAFWRLIRGLAGAGKTVFVTTHYMDEAEQCGRIVLMRSGRIVALDSPAGLKRSTFPLPVVELEAGDGAPEGWRERWFADGRAGDLSPHGMRWHLAVRDPAAWARVSAGLPSAIRQREIAPSLEDVFMRVVEGGAEP